MYTYIYIDVISLALPQKDPPKLYMCISKKINMHIKKHTKTAHKYGYIHVYINIYTYEYICICKSINKY
jgi:hypothetical protein